MLTGGVAVLILVVAALVWFGRDRGGTREPAASAVADPTTAVSADSFGAATSDAALPSPTGSGAASIAPSAPSVATTPSHAATGKPSPASTPKGLVNTAGANLALHRPVRASGSEGDHWAPANAVDGDALTRWSSAFRDPQWLIVDLGAIWQVSRIRISWEHAYATAYRIEVSADGRNWTSVFKTTTGRGGVVTVDAGKTPARYVRLYGTKRSTQYGYSVLEFGVR